MDDDHTPEYVFDIREALAQCAAGLPLMDPKWVVWAEQQAAAGCETPEILELASVPRDPSRWPPQMSLVDVTNLLLPALKSLGYDLSNPTRLVHEYALIELSELFLANRKLWDVVGKLAELDRGCNRFGFQHVAFCLEMLDDLGLYGNLRKIEENAWVACDAKVRELHEQLLAFYVQTGCEVPADFPAVVYCTHKEGAGVPGTETVCQYAPARICVACRRGSCGDAWHMFARFMTLPDPVRRGSDCQFQAYWCPACRGLNCVQCLNLLDDFPDPPVYVCCRCGGAITGLALKAHDQESAVKEMDAWIARATELSN